MPVAVLTSTLHLLRVSVWTPLPSEQITPLVDPVTVDVDVPQPVQNLPTQAAPALSRPVWPPTCACGAAPLPTIG